MSGTAVVIGASIAGLAAARVLSDHYESVVVLERDELPEVSAPRRGVPQGRHAHILAAAGLRDRYAQRVARASQVVPELKSTFFGDLQLVVPSSRLLQPRVVTQALLHGRHPSARH